MSEFTQRATELADLMREYGLSEATLTGEEWKIAFRRRTHSNGSNGNGGAPADGASYAVIDHAPPAPEVAKGTPISSPMTGIYYSASSPTSQPFVTIGDRVEAGQVVALIEAMKVFNEITAPMSGVVLSIGFENGSLVNQGDHLMHVG